MPDMPDMPDEQELSMGIVMARNNLERVDEVTGKYHVKSLSIGTVPKTDR